MELLQHQELTEIEGPDLMEQFAPRDQLSQEVIQLAQYAIRKRQSRSQSVKQNIIDQFNSTFQLIGGVPRLALWADKNPTAFYALYSKMIPAAVKIDSTSLDPNALHEEDLKDISTDKLRLMLFRQAAALEPNYEVVAPQGGYHERSETDRGS